MSLPLVTAVAPRWEGTVASVAGSASGVHLARRCADVAELVGVAAAGLARVALVSSDLRGMDRSIVDRLRAEGVAVVGVHPPGDQDAARRLARWRVTVVLPADLTVEQLELAVEKLGAGPDDDAGTGRADLADDAGTGRADLADDVDRADLADQGGSSANADQDGPADGHGTGGSAATAHAGKDDRPRDGRVTLPASTDPQTAEATEDLESDLDLELRTLVEQERAGSQGGSGAGQGTPTGADRAPAPGDEPVGGREEPGEVVVVWGSYGSPGRTTVAVNLAAELATVLDPVLLVDADTYGASVAQSLAVLDEAPGLAAACRAADQGTLDEDLLDRLTPEVRPGLRVLTGLPRPDRWPEIRESALADVLEQARAVSRWVVVDVAPVLEQDEELSFDTAAPRRNGAALTALEAADRVVVVGAGDPLGLQRLVRALDLLDEHTRAPRTVVVTRVRPGPVGPEPGRRITEALHRFAGADAVQLVPEDRDALDAAMLHGRTLREVRPGSPARQAVLRLAALVTGEEAQAGGGRTGPRRWLAPWSRSR